MIPRAGGLRVLTLAGILLGGCASTQLPPSRQPALDRKAMAKTALRLWRERDFFVAVESLARHDNALAATQAFGDVMSHLYRKKKDLGGALAFGRAGVQYGLTTAVRVEHRQPALALKLRSAAKGISYNVASFTWPGWDEPGIRITPADLAAGMDAAKTNLRLAYDLIKGHLPVSRAHWMLGAHHLAAGDRKAARRMFEHAALHAAAAGARADELLTLGYAHLTDLLDAPADAARRKRFADTQAQLGKLKDGGFFVQQLDTARRVFAKR